MIFPTNTSWGCSYEDAMFTAMANFSEHPVHPITELEVFIGQILNNSGVQTQRQRERSIKLKDEFDRFASWIMEQMCQPGPLTGYASEFDSLERCLACLHVAGETDKRGSGSRSGHKRRGWDGLKSFRVVAACVLLTEVEAFEREYAENENLPLSLTFPTEDEHVERAFSGYEDGEEVNRFDLQGMLDALHQMGWNF